MVGFVALAALIPTPPVIAAILVAPTSVQISLVTPAVEPQTGIGMYALYRRTGTANFSLIASLTPAGFQIPYVDSGLTPGTTYDYYSVGIDNGPQHDTSAPSNIAEVVTPIPVPTGNIKAHFGFYGCFDYSGGVNETRFNNGDSAVIAATATNTVIGQPPDNLMGFSFIVAWRTLDKGTTATALDFTVPDLYANACRAKKKQYWIWIEPTNFVASGSSITTGNRCVPDWLINNNGLNVCQGNYSPLGSGSFPKWYNAVVRNACITMVQAVAARYESDPYFEGIIFGIGTANASFNGVDTLGTRAPQINYNTDYSDNGMISAYKTFMQAFRSAFATSNVWMSVDYLFNMAGSSSYSGQDVQWTGMFETAKQFECVFGGVDSWTRSWIYPNTPFTPNQNAYGAHNNTSYNRGVYADQIYRGWRGPTPGTGTGYVNVIRYGAVQELTEMGGYIGQFSAADVWSYRGTALDNVQYMMFDVNGPQAGNYGTDPNVTKGAPKAPNTLWNAATSYDATYGISVYRWIQQAGQTNQFDPYA